MIALSGPAASMLASGALAGWPVVGHFTAIARRQQIQIDSSTRDERLDS
jgi:hypothetical protein